LQKISRKHWQREEECSDSTHQSLHTWIRSGPACHGRLRHAIESIEDAFRNGPGDPNLTGIFDGARGTGKTALLTLPADAAEERGWIAARVSAVPGTLEDILVQAGKGRSDDVSRARISSIGTREAGTLGQEEDGRNWRSRLESLLDALEASGTVS
jgi:hypothetical protein